MKPRLTPTLSDFGPPPERQVECTLDTPPKEAPQRLLGAPPRASAPLWGACIQNGQLTIP